MAVYISLLMVAVVALGLVRYLETHAVFYPSKDIAQTPSVLGLDFEDLYLKTADGERINAWFVKSRIGAATIIFAHGNAGNIGDRLLKLKFFHDLGLNVLLFDYRGYGKSSGHPAEEGIYKDGLAVYDHAVSRSDIDPKKIIMYGTSLGGVVAIEVATKRHCAVLIVDSSITSAKESAKTFYPFLPAFFLRTKFDSIGKIRHIEAPKLIIHSPQDQLIPYSMGVKLYEAASEPKLFLRSAGGHNEAGIIGDNRTAAGFKQFLTGLNLL